MTYKGLEEDFLGYSRWLCIVLTFVRNGISHDDQNDTLANPALEIFRVQIVVK